MKELGLKILNENNWLEPDKVLSGFHRMQTDGSTQPLSISEWFIKIQRVKLEDYIPDEIKQLFDVARGTMTYGYFFYPIFTFASEQFTRIAETAVNMKCVTLGLPKRTNTFKMKIDWLQKHSLISSDSYDSWNNTVYLRNEFSHPKRQNIITPFMAIDLMDSIATNINQLYTILDKDVAIEDL